jgi:uncharacterized damage-inducible protein DinB
MNREILLLAEQIKDTYQGEPWFGRSTKEILNEIDEAIAFEKPNGQHSILELLWHMVTWKEFVINRLLNSNDKSIHYFEEKDWQKLDHSDRTLWQQGLQQFIQLHNELIEIIRQQKDEILSQRVNDKNYDFRKLLFGIKDHDIYHLGQIAYIKKMLQK